MFFLKQFDIEIFFTNRNTQKYYKKTCQLLQNLFFRGTAIFQLYSFNIGKRSEVSERNT